jgi:Zn-dependent peptidase ImmA (M78 family)
MPTALVKREWFRWQDLPTVANMFNVSTEAMARRLEKLGIIGQSPSEHKGYFRTTGLSLAA